MVVFAVGTGPPHVGVWRDELPNFLNARSIAAATGRAGCSKPRPGRDDLIPFAGNLVSARVLRRSSDGRHCAKLCFVSPHAMQDHPQLAGDRYPGLLVSDPLGKTSAPLLQGRGLLDTRQQGGGSLEQIASQQGVPGFRDTERVNDFETGSGLI